MGRVVKLEEVNNGKVVHRSKVATLDNPTSLEGLDDLGLRLADAKTLLARIQTQMVTRQKSDIGCRRTNHHPHLGTGCNGQRWATGERFERPAGLRLYSRRSKRIVTPFARTGRND